VIVTGSISVGILISQSVTHSLLNSTNFGQMAHEAITAIFMGMCPFPMIAMLSLKRSSYTAVENSVAGMFTEIAFNEVSWFFVPQTWSVRWTYNWRIAAESISTKENGSNNTGTKITS